MFINFPKIYRTAFLSLIGGTIFLIFFYQAYSRIDDDLYQIRDDGIITMSHAKNWVDYGFIGVGPSGERVEGYSAPVQFFIYSVLYFISEIDYDTYSRMQTAISACLLGALFINVFRDNWPVAIVLTALSARVLTGLTSFILWHGSGVENPITHVLYLSVILIFFLMAKKQKINYYLAIVIFIATISRLESVYHIAPLLVIFCGYWFLKYRNNQGLYFSLIVFILWIIFHAWRYLYFGDLIPNTAYAQGISIADNISNWINWDRSFIKQSLRLAKTIFSYHGGYLLFVFVFLLPFVRREKYVILLVVLIISTVITSYFNPFIFGKTRLDPTRTTTHMAVFVVLGMSAIIFFMANKKHLLWAAPLVLIAVLFSSKVNAVKPYNLCCQVTGFNSIRQEFAHAAAAENLPRPTIANPDLGVMSWYKQFNIVDLGRLGTPIMAKLQHIPILADYFFDYAAPDLIESHKSWSCHYYNSLFTDPRFRQNYLPIREGIAVSHKCKGQELPVGIWIRKDITRNASTRERRLIDDLNQNLSVRRLKTELKICQLMSGANCVYVARTAFRYLPEFRERGDITRLNEIFLDSRTREFDLYLINGYRDGQAHEAAIRFIVDTRELQRRRDRALPVKE